MNLSRLLVIQKPDKATLLLIGLSFCTLIPLFVIIGGMGQSDPIIWAHLVDHQLPLLLTNTIGLVALTALFSLFIGTSLAWLTSMYDFWGRSWLEWALMLPLAIPAYVMAFSQLGLFDFTGPIQTLLRKLTGHNVQAFFPLRSMIGVSLVMSLAFYPYVYLLARNAFKTMGQRALEVGQSLGYSPRRAFWKIVLPMARPWLIGGTMLVIMETLADFGAVSIFNYDTLTTGIYKAWFALFSLPTAQRLAALLLLTVLLIVGIERYWRGKRAYTTVGHNAPSQRTPLSGWKAWQAALFAWLICLLAFILPVGQLIIWAIPTIFQDLNPDFMMFVRGSLILALMACICVTVMALLLSFSLRYSHSSLAPILSTFATIGYAVPGTVLAVGVFIPIAWLDNILIGFWEPSTTHQTFLKGSLSVMMWAYIVRFWAVAHSSVNASMQRVTFNQEYAAHSLGIKGLQMFRRLHLPLMHGGLMTALTMVFIDVMKEMPITLMMRPFGWDTLSVRIFSLTSEGLWREAALPSLILIIASLLPVLYLVKQEHQEHKE